MIIQDESGNGSGMGVDDPAPKIEASQTTENDSHIKYILAAIVLQLTLCAAFVVWVF
jgi:hypothetical protein